LLNGKEHHSLLIWPSNARTPRCFGYVDETDWLKYRMMVAVDGSRQSLSEKDVVGLCEE